MKMAWRAWAIERKTPSYQDTAGAVDYFQQRQLPESLMSIIQFERHTTRGRTKQWLQFWSNMGGWLYDKLVTGSGQDCWKCLETGTKLHGILRGNAYDSQNINYPCNTLALIRHPKPSSAIRYGALLMTVGRACPVVSPPLWLKDLKKRQELTSASQPDTSGLRSLEQFDQGRNTRTLMVFQAEDGSGLVWPGSTERVKHRIHQRPAAESCHFPKQSGD